MEPLKESSREASFLESSSSFDDNSTTPQSVEDKSRRKDIKLVPPDGGWGWFVVFGAFLTSTLCTFAVFGFSIIFLPLLSSFNASSAKIAWIFNVHRLIWSIFALLVSALNEQFGWRKLTIFGGILNTLSLILSSFSTCPDFLFFSYSFLGGVGGSISMGSNMIAVSKYFDKHRGFAIGITSLGPCVSAFLSPIISNYLIQNFGYVGASRIFGAIILNQCVGACLLQPLEWHMIPDESNSLDDDENDEVLSNNLNETTENNIMSEENEGNKFYKRKRKLSAFSAYSVESLHHTVIHKSSRNKHSLKSSTEGFTTVLINVLKSSYYNLALLQYHKMIIVALASGCFTMGYINFQLWIPFVVIYSGYSLEAAAWCMSAASVLNVVGRVLISFVSDRKYFNVTYGHMSGVFLMSLAVIAFSLAEDFTLFLIFVCCWGFGTGVAGSSSATNMIKILGVDLFPATYGIASLFRGTFSIIFGPIAGYVRDMTSSYTYALCLLGVVSLVGVILYLLLPLAEKHDRKKDFTEKLRKLEQLLK